MRILLDTHIFLWFISGDARLAPALVNSIRDPANEVYLNVVSIWEAIVKYQNGKLPFSESPEILIPRERQNHLFQSLPIDEASVFNLAALPRLHRNPFDRMLVSQAIANNLALATVDNMIRKYPVQTI